MSRYVIRAARHFVETPLYDDQKASLVPDLSVDGRKEVNTGLVCSRGNPIMRLSPPVGFGRDNGR